MLSTPCTGTYAQGGLKCEDVCFCTLQDVQSWQPRVSDVRVCRERGPGRAWEWLEKECVTRIQAYDDLHCLVELFKVQDFS